MDGPTLKSLPPFNTIGHLERKNILQSLKRPLSGYLGGGTPRGGYWTDRLEEEWTHRFKCQYAVPCNSGTSGLFAACIAAGIKKGDVVWTTPYTMSATAACAMVMGATVKFIDIEPIRFSINLNMLTGEPPKAIIVTNLFGHPAYLSALRSWCDLHKVIMIEDNAQSVFAQENGKYAGTIGHMGVFSLNVHKHLQCGEGGVVCTNDGEYSSRLRGAINHGELRGTNPPIVGLNLRMTEPIAAIACAQLTNADTIMKGRRRYANALTEMMYGVSWVSAPVADVGCTHSYYVWAALIEPDKRRKFVHELSLRGFPIKAGYATPLVKIFKSEDKCPTTLKIETQQIATIEVCAHDPKAYHIRRMKEIVDYVAEGMKCHREERH